MFSDRGPQNEWLGNRDNAAAQKAPRAPTSGMENLGNEPDDFYRQPSTPPGNYSQQPPDTITPARLTLSVRMRWNAIKGFDPKRYVDYLDQWRLGFFRMAGWTWIQMMQRDYQLQIDPPKRIKAVARHGYEVLQIENVPDGDTALAEQQVEFLKGFYGGLQATNAIKPDETGGIALLVRQMMEAQAFYYAVHNIVWQPDDAGGLTAKLIYIPIYWVEGTRGKLRYLQSEFQVYGVDMEPGEWMVTCGAGLMEACGLLYAFKNMALRNWAQLLDRLGGGGIMAKTPAAYGGQEWANLFESLKEFANEWTGVFSQNTDISLLESKNVTGDGPFFAMIDKMDKAVTQIWRGTDTASSVKPNSVGASVQQDESEIFETDDAQILEDTLHERLTKYALFWKFGEDCPIYARVELKTTPKDTTTSDLAIDEFLSPFGLLTKKATCERYNRPIPEDGDEILEPPPPPIPLGPDGKPKQMPGKPQFGNAALDTALLDKSIGGVADGWRKMMAPLAERLAGIAEIPDETLARAAMAKLKRDLDDPHSGLIPAVLENRDMAKALANAMTAGFFNGVAATVQQQEAA